MNYILDKFFFVFHSAIILFNLFGWIFPATRRANLILLLLTGFSWFILGIWYGIGYCPCTDWHWQIRMKLGDQNLPNSYVKFLIDSITGLNVNARLVDIVTVIAYFSALIVSLYVNLKDLKLIKSFHLL